MSTQPDNLDSLSDAELSEVFAVEVGGYTREGTDGWAFCPPRSALFLDSGDLRFAKDADAILPWLEKCESWQCLFDQGEMREYTVQVWVPRHATAEAESFARAACLALVRAHRAQKGAE